MLGGACPAMTASPTGMIEGVAKDAHGQPLPGVQLTLRAVTGGIAKQATRRPDGRYSFGDIAAGDYSIWGTKEGFAMTTAAVAVRAEEHISADLTLAAASAGAPSPAAAAPPFAAVPPTPGPAPVEIEEVNIIAKQLEAAGAAIEPQIGASTYTVTRQAIEAQPGGANNTLNQVLLQAPGVSQGCRVGRRHSCPQ